MRMFNVYHATYGLVDQLNFDPKSEDVQITHAQELGRYKRDGLRIAIHKCTVKYRDGYQTENPCEAYTVTWSQVDENGWPVSIGDMDSYGTFAEAVMRWAAILREKEVV